MKVSSPLVIISFLIYFPLSLSGSEERNIHRRVREQSIITPEIRKLLFDNSVKTPEQFKEKLLALGVTPAEVDSTLATIRRKVEEKISTQLRKFLEREEHPSYIIPIFGRLYCIGLSDINGEINSMLAKVGSQYRALINLTRVRGEKKVTLAFRKIIQEYLYPQARAFIFGETLGDGGFSNLPPAVARTEGNSVIYLFLGMFRKIYDRIVELAYKDVEIPFSDFPELVKALDREMLLSHGVDSVEKAEEDEDRVIQNDIQAGISHELGHVTFFQDGRYLPVLVFSSLIQEQNNFFYFLTEAIADFENLAEIVRLSEQDEKKAIQMALLLLVYRSLPISGKERYDKLRDNFILSLLFNFMERESTGKLRIRFTELGRTVAKLRSDFKQVTEEGIELVKMMIEYALGGVNLEEEKPNFRRSIEQEFPGVEISEWELQKAFWNAVFFAASSRDDGFADSVAEQVERSLGQAIWQAVNVPEVFGEYAGEYEQFDFTSYILQRAKELGFVEE